jgi:hypothetical protein
VNGPLLALPELKLAAVARLAAYEKLARLPYDGVHRVSLYRVIRELGALIREMEEDMRLPVTVVAGLRVIGDKRLDLGEVRRDIAAHFQGRLESIGV